MATRQDLTIEKGSKYYKGLNVTDAEGVARSLVGKTIKCTIRESTATSTNLLLLTEANGGVIVLNDALGQVALYISATDTKVEPDYGVYVIEEVDTAYPLLETERLLEGQVTFTKGLY